MTPHLDSMMARGSVSRPDLGLVPITITPSIAASLIWKVIGESRRTGRSVQPAGQAGLQSGDVVTAIDNRPLYNMGDFWHAIATPTSTWRFKSPHKGKIWDSHHHGVSRPSQPRP